MPISFEDISEQHRRIAITGRLDIAGTDEIATKFPGLAAASAKRIVVDLTGVTFLASIGIRAFVSTAKAVHGRGGKMVLFVGENEVVRKTLEATGVDVLIPLFSDLAEADQAANA